MDVYYPATHFEDDDPPKKPKRKITDVKIGKFGKIKASSEMRV